MCGIAGLALAKGQSESVLRSRAAAMNQAIAHRGPDGAGLWTDAEAGVALAQRRLAIIDLTDTGAQPMASASGRHVITYNGEIYNFPDLRRQLEEQGVAFKGASDTEVLVEAWELLGQDRTLAALNGMFAFAIWDRSERRLTLARDHFGIKPLAWFETAEGIVFASELKALLKDPACPRTMDPGSIAAFLRHGNVPAPWTILQGVRKLAPGTVMTWQAGKSSEVSQFWSPLAAMIKGKQEQMDASFADCVSEAEHLIGDSVERQMIADVPLGAFLSGGVDSSLVVAMMQQRAGRAIDTFTVGFEEPRWDESPYAAKVAQHLGTRHHTLPASGRDALALAESIASIYDEPFADSSQIPTLLLCRQVRQHVTVALSGDGGDEAFAGYERYGWGMRLHQYQRWVPRSVRCGAAALLAVAPLSALDGLGRLTGAGRDHFGHKLQRASRLGASSSFVEGYRQLLSMTTNVQGLLRNPAEHHSIAYDDSSTSGLSSPLSRMQAMDALSYLPDDILVKVDRASMSAGLEVRVPLLDYRLWEFAARIPAEAHRSGNKGKAVLRAVLHRHVPAELVERSKAGFAVPLARWLRGGLKDWAEDVLLSSDMGQSETFHAPAVQALWAEHIAGRRDHAPVLWSILMLLSWQRSVLDA